MIIFVYTKIGYIEKFTEKFKNLLYVSLGHEYFLAVAKSLVEEVGLLLPKNQKRIGHSSRQTVLVNTNTK